MSSGRLRQQLNPNNQNLDWQEQAACLQMNPDLFFPEQHSKDGAKARAVCARCPVREACLDYAVRNDEKYGIWGGANRNERAEIRRRNLFTPEPVSKRCPGCDTWKPAAEFGPAPSRRDGLRSECRACTTQRDRTRARNRQTA